MSIRVSRPAEEIRHPDLDKLRQEYNEDTLQGIKGLEERPRVLE